MPKTSKYIKKFFCPSIKMENLSLKEPKRNISGYKSMPKDKLLGIINNNNNKGDRKSLFKLKKEETKKSLYKPTRNSLFKLKREKVKKNLNKPAKKNLYKLKIKKVRKILYESKLNENIKIEKIKKNIYDPKIICLNQKKVIANQ